MVRLLGVILITLVVAVSIVSGLSPAPSSGQSTGKVKGTVLDFNGAAIVTPKPTIVVKGRDQTRELHPDENGDYEVELPAGIYSISAEITGFFPFRRAAFRVQPDVTTMINIVPTPRYLVRGTTVGEKAVDIASPRPRYDSFSPPKTHRGSPDLLIQFIKKRARNKTVFYEGAVVSYDTLTIYADKLRFNKKMLQLEASGIHVIVEDGKQRMRVRFVRVRFKEGKPITN